MQTLISIFKLTFIIVISVIYFACSDSPTITELSSDDILKSQLIGEWQNGPWYSIEYYSDGTFKDKSIMWFWNSFHDTLTTIRVGKYKISRGILEYSEIKHHFLSTSGKWRGYSTVYPLYEINIIGDNLSCRVFDRLQLVKGSSNQLWGSWDVTSLTVFPISDTNKSLYEGRKKRKYTFISDSSYFFEEWFYLDDTSFSPIFFFGKVIYNHPKLLLGEHSSDTIEVAFLQNEMRWYRGKFSLKRIR